MIPQRISSALATLSNDVEQALRERDQTIERQGREIESLNKRAQERAASLEEELRATTRRLRDDHDRKLASEVDRRLAEREHSLREELAASAAAELSERERQISQAYERAAADREAMCKRREAASEKRAQDAEREAATDLRAVEDRWKTMEAELREKLVMAERAKTDAETRLRQHVAETNGVVSQQNEQLEQTSRELKGLEKESARLREENAQLEERSVEKDSKISDLLQTLMDLEAEFVRQHRALQTELDAVVVELENKCGELEVVHGGATHASSAYEKTLAKLEKKLEKRKRQWAEREMVLIDKAESLRVDLDAVQSSKQKGDERARKDLDTAKSTIGDLEIQIARLQEQSVQQKIDAESVKQELEKEKRHNESLRHDHQAALKRLGDSKTSEIQDVKTKHQTELDRVQKEAIDDVRRALIDKNAMSEDKKRLERNAVTLQSKISSLESKLEECQRTCTNEVEVEQLRRENDRLQDTCSVLRSEMEARDSSEKSRDAELVQRVGELSDELDVVLEDRRRLIELSHKLRTDLQRLQSEQSGADVGNTSYPDENDQFQDDGALTNHPLSLFNISTAEEQVESSGSGGGVSGRRGAAAISTNTRLPKLSATSQGTQSQREAFARLGRKSKKDREKKIRERPLIRNWNQKVAGG